MTKLRLRPDGGIPCRYQLMSSIMMLVATIATPVANNTRPPSCMITVAVGPRATMFRLAEALRQAGRLARGTILVREGQAAEWGVREDFRICNPRAAFLRGQRTGRTLPLQCGGHQLRTPLPTSSRSLRTRCTGCRIAAEGSRRFAGSSNAYPYKFLSPPEIAADPSPAHHVVGVLRCLPRRGVRLARELAVQSVLM
jgi:hypothetical protein